MSKKRYIDTNFWSDTWIEQLNRNEKFFFLYLITNERTSIAGIYEISLKRMALETDLTKEEIAAIIKRMGNKVCYIDGWIVLRNGVKSQNYRNDKIKRGIKAILESCPVELLQYIDLPKDLDIEVERAEPEPKQQRLIDDSSMTQDGSLHLIKYNRIKYKSNTDAPKVAVGSKIDKKAYAKSADADRQQMQRASRATTRSRKPITPISQEDIEKAYEKRTMK